MRATDFGKSHVCLLDMHARATPAQSRGVRRAVWPHTHALTRAHTCAHRYTHVHTHTVPTSSRAATLVSAHLHVCVTSLLPFCPRLCPPVRDPTSSGA